LTRTININFVTSQAKICAAEVLQTLHSPSSRAPATAGAQVDPSEHLR